MNQASDKIQLMRDQQLTRGMKAVAILGLFAVLASLSRVFVLGWHFIMSVHVALYLIVLAIVFLKSRLSFHFRASAIIILPFILGVAGLTSWGLMAYGLVSLYSFCILATILLGSRAGIYCFRYQHGDARDNWRLRSCWNYHIQIQFCYIPDFSNILDDRYIWHSFIGRDHRINA